MRITPYFDFALVICAQIFGPTSAMSPAIRTNTTLISISVKPRWRRNAGCLFMKRLVSNRNVVDGEHRREDGDDDEADDERHRDDHHGLQERQRLADRDLDLAVVGLGHLHEHFVEAPGLFPDL